MRRPLLLIFIVILFVSYLYTNFELTDKTYDNKVVTILGTVKDKIEKEKYDEYKIDNFLVRDYSRRNKLTTGNNVKISGKFKCLDDMKYEDFNYGRYLRSMGYKGIIYINKYEKVGEDIVFTYLGKISNYVSNTNRYLYKKNSDFINSILLGQKEDLSEEEKLMFSRTGTSHIIAISGLHTGIICVLITFILGGMNKVYKLLILTVIMILYCAMVGLSPSIVRAIVFVIILYLAVFIDRKRDGISTLSLIGSFLIINNPYIIYNISFQLSFLSTLSIIYFYGYINSKLKLSLVSLTISANILILPIMYYNFKGIPIISVISNVIIVPFIGIIIYFSIISVILFKINIGLSKIIVYFNRALVNTIYFLLEKISDIEFSYIDIENPKLYFVVTYYIVVFSYMVYKELKVIKEQANELQGYYK